MIPFSSKSVAANVTTDSHGALWAYGPSTVHTIDLIVGRQYTGKRDVKAIHEFGWSRTEQDYLVWSAGRNDGWATTTIGTYPPGMYDPSDSAYTNARNIAIDKIYNQLRGGIDLSIDGFEARKTARTFKNVANVVRSFGTLARELSWSPLKAASQKYLEWTYGIKPTLQTIYDSFDQLYNGTTTLFTVCGRGRTKTEYTGEQDLIPYGLSGPWAKAKFLGVNRTRCEIGLKLRCKHTRLQDLAGWTSLNPINIAWELTRFSFVVDWFWNFGGYIRNLESSFVFDDLFFDGYETRSFMDLSEFTDVIPTYPGVTVLGFNRGERMTKGMHRVPLAGMPVPRPPIFRSRLSSKRLLNAATLLGSFLKHPPQYFEWRDTPRRTPFK